MSKRKASAIFRLAAEKIHSGSATLAVTEEEYDQVARTIVLHQAFAMESGMEAKDVCYATPEEAILLLLLLASEASGDCL